MKGKPGARNSPSARIIAVGQLDSMAGVIGAPLGLAEFSKIVESFIASFLSKTNGKDAWR